MQDNIEYDLYAVLKELVELRDMKDEFQKALIAEKGEAKFASLKEYNSRKPLAWENARMAIKQYENDKIR